MLRHGGDLAIWAAAALAATGTLWRLTRSPRHSFAAFVRALRDVVYDLRGVPEVRDPRSDKVIQARVPSLREAVFGDGTPGNPGLREQVAYIDSQLKANGGGSLRDLVGEVHELTRDNNARHDDLQRIVDAMASQLEATWRRSNDAAVLSGEAAQVAARADQGVHELRREVIARHLENVARLDSLEESARNTNILRELLLSVLRDEHGIDLIPDDDEGGAPGSRDR